MQGVRIVQCADTYSVFLNLLPILLLFYDDFSNYHNQLLPRIRTLRGSLKLDTNQSTKLTTLQTSSNPHCTHNH